MTVTVTDFERITGVSRHTVYAWFYRDKFPAGIQAAPSLGTTKILKIKKASKYYEKVEKQLV